MAKKNLLPKIPSTSKLLKELMNQTSSAETAFLNEKSTGTQNIEVETTEMQSNTSSPLNKEEKDEKIVSAIVSPIEEIDVIESSKDQEKATDRQAERFNIKERNKEKEIKRVGRFEYVEYFKEYEDNDEPRSSAYLYETNMNVLRTIAMIEKCTTPGKKGKEVTVMSLLNQIVAAFVFEYQDDISKTLKKATKLL